MAYKEILTIKMHPVISSNVAAAGYDETSQTLRIRFANGQEYEYQGIPKWAYDGIFTAESAGKYVRDHIVKGKPYKFSKVKK